VYDYDQMLVFEIYATFNIQSQMRMIVKHDTLVPNERGELRIGSLTDEMYGKVESFSQVVRALHSRLDSDE
jgi:hypothetical protein